MIWFNFVWFNLCLEISELDKVILSKLCMYYNLSVYQFIQIDQMLLSVIYYGVVITFYQNY